MSEDKPSRREIRSMGAHLGITPEVPTDSVRSPITNPGMFDEPKPFTAEEDALRKAGFASPEVKAYFRGRDLPTYAWAPDGIAYYEKAEDIPEALFPKTDKPPKIASWETRAAVALRVCPPAENEVADASFKFIGERGLYVRVILGEVQEKVGEITRKKPIIRWMHFNEEAADFKNIRYA